MLALRSQSHCNNFHLIQFQQQNDTNLCQNIDLFIVTVISNVTCSLKPVLVKLLVESTFEFGARLVINLMFTDMQFHFP